jgi:hypothetical protein
MADHAWCRDVARDEAVRAAEDNRTGPLPTLGECIDGMFPKSVSASSPVEHENKGVGMHTERVTLEITHDESFSVSHWSWVTILRIKSGESVRVVEAAVGSVDDRAYADRMGCDEERDFANRILTERDAAIRDREKLRGEITSVLDRAEQARSEHDALRARVAALEAASGGGEQPRGWLTEQERDLIAGITDDDEYTEEGQNIARGLLARSSPPEVRLPLADLGDRLLRDGVIDALAAAGVAVKEVG